jgi:U3 small nucleolar RNA-associated protein 15
VKPLDLAACTAFKLQIYSADTFSLKREITRTKETIHTASYREDGKLLVLGDSTGLLQVDK